MNGNEIKSSENENENESEIITLNNENELLSIEKCDEIEIHEVDVNGLENLPINSTEETLNLQNIINEKDICINNLNGDILIKITNENSLQVILFFELKKCIFLLHFFVCQCNEYMHSSQVFEIYLFTVQILKCCDILLSYL